MKRGINQYVEALYKNCYILKHKKDVSHASDPNNRTKKLTCTGVIAAVAAGSLTFDDSRTGPRLDKQHWRLLGVNTGGWGLADVRGGCRG